MNRTLSARIASKAVLPLSAALVFSLAACEKKQEPTYEAGAEDVSGGELIVTEQTPAVPVEVPKTEMTPVPPPVTSSPTPTGTATPAAE